MLYLNHSFYSNNFSLALGWDSITNKSKGKHLTC